VAVFAAVVAVVTGVVAIALSKALAPEQDTAQLSLLHRDAWLTVGRVALYAALAAVLAVSLGALLRHAAAAITILLLWPFVVEPLLSSMPRIGDRISPFLPFINAYEFIGLGMYRDDRLLWGPVAALLYFTAFVAVLFVAAVFVTIRRDP
jgi:ABC-2 type transport system permease protein